MTTEAQLLALFRQQPDQFHSGEQLRAHLQVSRTAIWKKIKKLEREGYRFEASSRLGYRLLAEPEVFDFERYEKALHTVRFGRTWSYQTETNSTQNVARELTTQGATEGHLVLAETQTAGRGRFGRAWHSPKGKGIWMSFILQPKVPVSAISQITLLIAVSLCKTLREVSGLPIGIKWPNDLLIDGKKISGILLEGLLEEERIVSIIAGVGISVNLDAEDYPDELKTIAQSLKMANAEQPIARERILATFMNTFEAMYDDFQQNGFETVRQLWEQWSVTLAKHVQIKQVNQTLAGYAVGIDEQGALRLQMENGETVTCYSGDLVF
jgi:BirA family biotin operon repressor/biotin-[acetyl-CoA-carboxylase] ligase